MGRVACPWALMHTRVMQKRSTEQKEKEAHPEQAWQHNHENHLSERRRVLAVRAGSDGLCSGGSVLKEARLASQMNKTCS